MICAIGSVAMAQTPRSACLGSRDLTSPDGALIAHVTRSGRGNCGESKLEIFEADGHLLLTADYGSSDGEHGEGVAMAAWSADSRFFVFSLVDEADKAATRYRLDFFRRDTNKLRPITVLAPDLKVTQPSFKFGDGDALEVAGEQGMRVVRLGGK
jgi:hypothetical protein